MADRATNKLSDYIERLGINVADLSRKTGLSYGVLQRSILKKERSLRANEFIEICGFLEKNPLDFRESDIKNGA